MNWRTRMLLIAYVLLSLGLTAGAVFLLRIPFAMGTSFETRAIRPGGPFVTSYHTLTWYGYPLPVESWTQVTDSAGNTLRWHHSQPNYPLAVSLFLLMWTASPAAWLTVTRLCSPVSVRRSPFRRFVWVTFTTAVGGIAIAGLALVMFGWSVAALNNLSPPQPVWQALYYSSVDDHLFGLHRKLGLQTGWPAYSTLTAVGMATGLVAGVAMTWLSARRAKRLMA